MNKPIELPGIRNITVSGRIGSGSTTLAQGLGRSLCWKLLEGGALFEKIHNQLRVGEEDVSARPDDFDMQYEEMVKKILHSKSHTIIQSHLAGFDAQEIHGVFKILVLCENELGNDKTEIRIDRLVNRKGISIEQAKEEVRKREHGNIEKWQRLYARGDMNWKYWDRKYYDLVINTYSNNQEQTLNLALQALGYVQ